MLDVISRTQKWDQEGRLGSMRTWNDAAKFGPDKVEADAIRDHFGIPGSVLPGADPASLLRGVADIQRAKGDPSGKGDWDRFAGTPGGGGADEGGGTGEGTASAGGSEAGAVGDSGIPGQGDGDQPGSGNSESGTNSATGPGGGGGTTAGGEKVGEFTVKDLETNDTGGFGYSWSYEGNDGSQVHGRTDCDGQGRCVDTYYDEDGNVVAQKEYTSDKGAPSEGTAEVVAVDCSEETNSGEPQCANASNEDSNMPDPEKAGCITKGCDEFMKWVNAIGIGNSLFVLDPQSTLTNPGGDEFAVSTRKDRVKNIYFGDVLRDRIDPVVNPNPECDDKGSDIVAPSVVKGPPNTDITGSLPDPEPNPIEGGEPVSPQNPKPGLGEGQDDPQF